MKRHLPYPARVFVGAAAVALAYANFMLGFAPAMNDFASGRAKGLTPDETMSVIEESPFVLGMPYRHPGVPKESDLIVRGSRLGKTLTWPGREAAYILDEIWEGLKAKE